MERKNDFRTYIKFLALEYVVLLVFNISFCEIVEYLTKDESIFKGNSVDLSVLFYVMPLIETIFFQFIILWVFYNIFENHKMGLILSSIGFGMFHFFNVYYVIEASFSGFILAYFFIKYLKISNWFIASLITFLVHLLYNLSVCLLFNS